MDGWIAGWYRPKKRFKHACPERPTAAYVSKIYLHKGSKSCFSRSVKELL